MAHGPGRRRVPQSAVVVHTSRPQAMPERSGLPLPIPQGRPARWTADGFPDDPPSSRPTARRSAGCRPHNLQAEESLLGAMLLSRDAIAAAVRARRRRRLLQAGPRPHLRRHHARSTAQGEPVDPVTVADELRRAGLLDAIGGPATLRQPAGRARRRSPTPARYAKIVEEHALLRRLIGVAGEIAEIGYDAARRRHQGASTRPSRWCSRSPSTASPTRMAPLRDLLDADLDQLEELYERGDADHRHAHRLHRPRRAPRRACSRRADRRRRPPGHGQDRLRARAWPPTPALEAQRAGAVLLARDEPPRADPAHPVLRGPGRRQPRCATAARPRPTGRRSATPSAAWPRRRLSSTTTPTSRSWRSGPRPAGSRASIGDLGADRRRLPPADDRPARRPRTARSRCREISRGLKILARELECPVVALVAAQPQPRAARRQAADARRPA